MAERDFFHGEIKEVMRSEIKFSDYNPRMIDEDGKKALKRSIKKFGVVGGYQSKGQKKDSSLKT